METFEDQIDYYKDKIKEYEKLATQNIMEENKNLKEQNKQLLITLIDHLTKSRSRRRSKRKKNHLSGTLINAQKIRKSALDNSRRRLSRRKKGSQRKHSSKRRANKDRINLGNLNSMMEYKYMPSLTSMNKNFVKEFKINKLVNNYQSFDSTLNKAMMENILHNARLSNENQEGHIDQHYHSVKTPQADRNEIHANSKSRPKTAVRREQEKGESIHSNSHQVQYAHDLQDSNEKLRDNL